MRISLYSIYPLLTLLSCLGARLIACPHKRFTIPAAVIERMNTDEQIKCSVDEWLIFQGTPSPQRTYASTVSKKQVLKTLSTATYRSCQHIPGSTLPITIRLAQGAEVMLTSPALIALCAPYCQ